MTYSMFNISSLGLCVSLLAVALGDILNEDCPFVFSVEHSIKNEGFHRNVEYYFELLSERDISDCAVCFKQAIPNSLYVNKDQVTELVRLGKLAALVDGPVDIEAPADKSTPHVVFLFTELASHFNTMNATVALPVHTRYHQARKDGGFEEAVLPAPEVYLSCSVIPEQCLSGKLSLDSCPASDLKIQFFSTKYETQENSSEILIPVGNTSHYEIVQLFTFIVTWAGSKFIYYTLLNNKPKDGL